MGKDVWGQKVRVQGRTAPVHEPLTVAADVTKNGDMVVLTAGGGYIVSRDSTARNQLEKQ